MLLTSICLITTKNNISYTNNINNNVLSTKDLTKSLNSNSSIGLLKKQNQSTNINNIISHNNLRDSIFDFTKTTKLSISPKKKVKILIHKKSDGEIDKNNCFSSLKLVNNESNLLKHRFSNSNKKTDNKKIRNFKSNLLSNNENILQESSIILNNKALIYNSPVKKNSLVDTPLKKYKINTVSHKLSLPSINKYKQSPLNIKNSNVNNSILNDNIDECINKISNIIKNKGVKNFKYNKYTKSFIYNKIS